MYCTVSDIQATIPEVTLIQLTDDTGSDTVDTTKIDNAISYAREVIDGYLRGNYSLPFSAVPELLKHISIDLTVYKLYSRRQLTELPESITASYKNSVKKLEQIQKGIISLGINQITVEKEKVRIKSTKTSSDRYFNSDFFKGF